ncbi:MAG: phenylacetate--CoA ligase family protein [Candidatus Hodarchaeota archaeon]
MLYKLLRAKLKLRKKEYKKPEELRKIQQKRLRKLIYNAYENVEYYHRLFDSLGLKPDDIKTAGDLGKLPLTNKKVLRNNNLLSDRVKNKKLIKIVTSGSTGEPIEVAFTERDFAFVAATGTRVMDAAGVKTSRDRVAQLLMIGPYVGSTIVNTLYTGFVKLFSKLRIISIKKPLPEIVDELLEFDPTLISVYPSVAYSIGQYMAENELELPRLKTVVTGSEILDIKTRRGIEETLNAEVYDAYGLTEIHVFAYECSEHAGLHAAIDTAIMEVVDENNEPISEGERGRLILTPLMREAMPLIRYDTHDIVKISGRECDCGRTFPLIDIIEGRVEDTIKLPDGSLVYPQIVIGELGDIRELGNYQVIQPRMDTIEVSIVKGRDFSDKTT